MKKHCCWRPDWQQDREYPQPESTFLPCIAATATRLKHLAIFPRKVDFSCFGYHPYLESRLTIQEKWVLVDRSEEITGDGDVLDNLLQLITGPDARSKRRIAVQSGYRAITPFARRRGTRSSECDHAFVEDVTTLAAFVPRRECTVSLEH